MNREEKRRARLLKRQLHHSQEVPPYTSEPDPKYDPPQYATYLNPPRVSMRDRKYRINFEEGLGTGLGDLVMGCWFPKEYCFYVEDYHKKLICDLFGRNHPKGANVGAKKMQPAFRSDLSNIKMARLHNWYNTLNLEGELARPQPHISDSGLETAERLHKAHPNATLLFPFAAKKCRMWPLHHWIDLYETLEAEGYNPIMLIPEQTNELTGIKYYWGYSCHVLAALILKAKVTICNDSFPMHLASTLDKETIVLLGPSPDNAFWHYDMNKIKMIRSDMTCTPCNFRKPMRQACVAACESLHAITPEEVANAVRGLHD
jgi:hypothetical protein